MNNAIPIHLWRTSIDKVRNHANHYRVPDPGGELLLDILADSWFDSAADALTSGKWNFLPFQGHFTHHNKLQTLSSLLDRVIVQLALATPGWQVQQDLINANCDDELMPLPPAFRFRPPEAGYMYSNWLADHRLWQDAQRLFALRGYSWVVKADIRDCFYGINRHAAVEIVEDFMPDAMHKKLLRRRMQSPIEWNGASYGICMGLPVEEPTSHLLANAFMAQLDQWACKELLVPHVRFVDDMRFFCKSESEARSVLNALGETLQLQFGLRLNDTKSMVEKLSGDTDLPQANQLLKNIKHSITEPLEEHTTYYRRVPIDEVLDAWNNVHNHIESGVDSEVLNQSINLLADIRPALGAEPSFISLMQAILDRTAKQESVKPHIRHRLVGIAMGHLKYCNPRTQDAHLATYLDHPDEKISAIAFRHLVQCKTALAAQLCDDKIVSLHESGQLSQSRQCLRIYGQVFAITPRLRDLFAGDEDRTIRVLASDPRISDDNSVALIISKLADADPLIRRNAALYLARSPSNQHALVKALTAALRREKHRDARLAMLLAGKSCQQAFGSLNLGRGNLPKSKLEMDVSTNCLWTNFGVLESADIDQPSSDQGADDEHLKGYNPRSVEDINA